MHGLCAPELAERAADPAGWRAHVSAALLSKRKLSWNASNSALDCARAVGARGDRSNGGMVLARSAFLVSRGRASCWLISVGVCQCYCGFREALRAVAVC